MEYTAQDFTFWGQIFPQLIWIILIMLFLFIRAWYIEDKNHLKTRKEVNELLKKTSNKEIIKQHPPNNN